MNNKIRELIASANSQGVYLYLKSGNLCYDLTVDVFEESLKQQIIENKRAIVEFLGQLNKHKRLKAMAIPASSDKSNSAVLSSGQTRFWLIDQLEGGSEHYNLATALSLQGKLSIEAVKYAFDSIVTRHETLRTTFAVGDRDFPIQQVQKVTQLPIKIVEFGEVKKQEQSHAQALKTLVENEASQAFDLSKDLMLRATLIKVSPLEHIAIVCMHHIASDGWSMSILIDEFSEYYSAYIQQRTPKLPELAIQYSDYAEWQQQYLKMDSLQETREYWKTHLDGAPPVHSLPLDFQRPAEKTFKGEVLNTKVSQEETQALLSICQSQDATLFMALNSLLAAVISYFSRQTDIVIGTPVANREQPEVDSLIGLFVNTLVLRNDVSGAPSFNTLLGRSKTMLLDAYEHQKMPFDLLVEELNPERSHSYNPLFQIALVLQNNESKKLQLEEITLEPIEFEDKHAKFDLCIEVNETEQGLELNWEYATDLFKAATVERISHVFNRLLKFVILNPEQAFTEASLLSEAELNQQLIEFNGLTADLPSFNTIHNEFENWVAKAPDSIAIVSNNIEYTFLEINNRSNQLALYLRNNYQVKHESRVGVCLERSENAIISFLAVLKAGACYVPLDPANPNERNDLIIEQCGFHVVVTCESLAHKIKLSGEQKICLDNEYVQTKLSQQNAKNNSCELADESSLAYIMYTSGSSGLPKGVMIEHKNVVSLVTKANYVDLSSKTVMLFNAPISFDAATFEIWAPLLNGGRLVVQPELVPDVKQLGDFINQWNIDTAWLTSGLFDVFTASYRKPLLSLNQLLVGGDVVNPKSVKEIFRRNPKVQLINGYGPTENTTFSTFYKIPEPSKIAGEIPIGSPLQYRQAYVLDDNMAPLPIGVKGELYVGGAGVSRGYFANQSLTDEKFVNNPFTESYTDSLTPQLYRTGDIVNWDECGRLHYQGRNDFQVKMRGFRIELGEIETAMLQLPDIEESVVVFNKELSGETLVGYFKGQGNLDVEEVKSELTRMLPSYMLPGALVRLESFPLGVNGKIDRGALPLPELDNKPTDYIAPRTKIECQLETMWSSLLGREKPGLHANFFELGGHSLLLTRLNLIIQDEFDIDLSLKQLFAVPVLLDMAKLISLEVNNKLSRDKIVPVQPGETIPLSFSQYRMWLMFQMNNSKGQYNIPAALKLTGQLDVDALEKAINGVIQRHHILRTVYAIDESGEPVQQVLETQFKLGLEDFSSLNSVEQNEAIAKFSSLEAMKPFELTEDLMLRAHLVTLSKNESLLLLTIHHIAADGWSVGILSEEFGELYRAVLEGRESNLLPMKLQYSDYAYWQRNWLKDDVLEKYSGYWDTQLSGIPQLHSLPLDKPRSEVQHYAGSNLNLTISAAVTDKLGALCQQEEATLFMGLQAAFSAFLSRYSNETDIVMGTPIANREQGEIAGLIGFFANTLVLRSDLSDNPNFFQLLKRNKSMLLNAYAHQQTPFEQLVEKYASVSDRNHNPLFQIMLVMQNNAEVEFALPNLEVESQDNNTETAKFDIKLSAIEGEKGEGLMLTWNYDKSLFHGATIEKMASDFEHLLESLVSQPESSVLTVPMMTKSEIKQQLLDWNQTSQPLPDVACIHELFEAEVNNQPDSIAVSYQGTSLTYSALNAKANQLAHYLTTHHGVEHGNLVGLCLSKNLNTLVAILAVLKAGAAYVPLLSDYPAERMSYVIDDTKMKLMICDHTSEIKLSALAKLQLINIESEVVIQAVEQSLEHNLADAAQADSLAYVIYTSGSTGQPKGVLIEHKGAVNLAANLRRDILGEHQSWGWNVSYAFDGSVKGLLAMVSGCRLVVIPDEIKLSGREFIAYLKQESVELVDSTPSMFKALSDDEFTANEIGHFSWILGGESLSHSAWESIAKEVSLTGKRAFNAYGPTEGTVNATWTEIKADQQPHIGKPLGNVEVVVMQQGQLVPTGAIGELYLGGMGIARGYLNQDTLTAKSFIDNPYRKEGMRSERLYRTGDLVKWQSDGSLVFVGRNDDQVKIRGYRIELGEIESKLLQVEGIEQAVVVSQKDHTGEQVLVGYYCANEKLSAQEIKGKLETSLPSFMVPTVLQSVDEFTLTSNGKIDKSCLPKAAVNQVELEYIAPTTDMERELCEIWQEVLNIEKVGIKDNFFLLGGHSLLAAKVKIAIYKHFKVDLRIEDIFVTQDIEELAKLILRLTYSVNDVNQGSEELEEFEW